MRFVRENPALAAGIGLPVLLVIFFTLATLIPQWTVAPPEYDVIFSIRDYGCISGDAKANFEVFDGRIKAKYIYVTKEQNNYANCSDNERIYRFDAKNMVSREITVKLPGKQENSPNWQDFEVAELKDLQIDNNPVAPDGYKFTGTGDYYYGGLFPFYGSSSSKGMSISKNGRAISISPINRERYYSYNNINLLGWVISEAEGDKK